MELNIKEIKDKDVWERFLSETKERSFLQSWDWGEFNRGMGDKIFRFGIYKNNELAAVALAIKTIARRGTFLFLPHGPSFAPYYTVQGFGGQSPPSQTTAAPPEADDNQQKREGKANTKFKIIEFLLGGLKDIAKKEKVDFIRIAPLWERNGENIGIFKKLGFRTAPIHVHPELTWELDIKPEKEELLMQMRKTTRYLIKKAQRNQDVRVIKSKNIKDIEKFNNLYRETKERQHFTPFSLDYLRKEFLSFNTDDQIIVFLGNYKNETVSSGIFIFWKGIGFYHHGASSLKYPKIPVSYLLLWEAIKEAKARGCGKFNFWGIAPVSESGKVINRSHPWAGLTLFKMGFGGNKKQYLKTQDFVISQKYWISFVIEQLRRIKRGL